MTSKDPRHAISSLTDEVKRPLGLLALAGEPMGRKRIFDCLKLLYPGSFTESASNADLAFLHEHGLIQEITGRGFIIVPAASWPALKAVIDNDEIENLAAAYLHDMPVRMDWQGRPVLRSYRQGVALLRLALVTGKEQATVAPLLAACLACHEAAYSPPFVDICARPFEPELLDHIYPRVLEGVLAVLVQHAQREPAVAADIRAYAERHAAHNWIPMDLRVALAEHLILCGRLDDAGALLVDLDDSAVLFYRSVILLLRDQLDEALAGFDAALKLLRRETGKRKAIFPGIGGHLYVTAMLRRDDPAQQKALDTYLDSATRAVQSFDTAVYQQLSMLRQIRGGTVDPDVLPSRNWEAALQPVLFRALMHWWLGMPQLANRR